MSHETRTIRPFVGLGPLEGMLDSVLLYFGDAPCQPDDNLAVDLDPHSFLRKPITLQWAVDETGLDEFKRDLPAHAGSAGFAESDLSLLVVARSVYLKRAAVLLDLPISGLDTLDRTVRLDEPSRTDVFDSPHHGFRVEVYLALNRSLEPVPLRPYRKGTWIAQVRFKVATSLVRVLFRPIPLTDELRERMNLPKKTMRFVDFESHELLEPMSEQPSEPAFYIDADLIGRLSVSARSAAGRALQLQLAQDFISAVVFGASKKEELTQLTIDDVDDSLLGNIIRLAAGPGSTRGERALLLQQVRDQPARVIANAEHTIGIQKHSMDSLVGEDTP